MNDTRVTQPTVDLRVEAGFPVLMSEELTRIRMNDLIREAQQQRLAHKVGAGRLWRRLAVYAADRADRAQRCQ
ncbi:hypothetical protein [Saccharopolyspora taberi]|uniref:Uncharacterized protein n=1 Tax=Saccharopolyspora taberi TaxID=60895 RepID=A0ABN3VJE9_9PSEU